jgi:hypothetical protein
LNSRVAGVSEGLRRKESVFRENSEINYFLRKVEGYLGLAIRATNMKFLFDRDFLKRPW